MERQLPEKDIHTLKQRGLLRESETAFKDGNVIVAEDLLTKTRRIVNVVGLVLEANKQVLHD